MLIMLQSINDKDENIFREKEMGGFNIVNLKQIEL